MGPQSSSGGSSIAAQAMRQLFAKNPDGKFQSEIHIMIAIIFFKVFQANVFGGNMFQCRYIFMYVGTHSLPAASTKMALMHCASFKMLKLRHSSILLWQTPTRTNSRQHLSRLKIAAWSCQWLRFNLSLYSSIKGNRGHEIWKVFSNS